MSTSLLPANASFAVPVARPTVQPGAFFHGSGNGQVGRHTAVPPRDRDTHRAIQAAVEISPSHLVERRAVMRQGVTAEIVKAKSLDKIEFRFRAPMDLLVVCAQGARRQGDTFVEGLPRSTLRDLTHKLTFVPAGHEYHEWQDPRVLTRLVYFYFDPGSLPILDEPASAGRPAMRLAPRLFFEDEELFCTARKLQALIENPQSDNHLHFEALGVVLAHELLRVNSGAPSVKSPARGGLAAWQERIVADHIEENLAQQIPLATLASLVRLSPHYFCRAFKQSFRVPPHRYHSNRRIEHAKMLLARPTCSVTQIGLALGFSTTSSFTASFRKATGRTPTEYRRSLA
jgi:AraC family transcriptional regulator